MAEQMINCFGSYLDNLTDEEFYQIHHNVHATLTHQKGNQLFERYLQRKQLVDSLKCLDMYNITLRILRNSSEESLESLIAQVVEVQEMGEDMNEIHQDLERQIEEALRQRYRIMLIEVLENIKQECQDRLNDKHEGFINYIMRCRNMT